MAIISNVPQTQTVALSNLSRDRLFGLNNVIGSVIGHRSNNDYYKVSSYQRTKNKPFR